jgi:hypothetical protein
MVVTWSVGSALATGVTCAMAIGWISMHSMNSEAIAGRYMRLFIFFFSYLLILICGLSADSDESA